MGFWDNLGVQAPAQPTPPPAAYPPAFAPQPQYPAQPPQGYPQQPQGYPMQQEDPQVESSRRRAQSSKSARTCPSCGSGNIFKPHGMANMMEQCYECGWNPRFEQSTSGAGVPSTAETGPAKPARQVSTANNFNPQVIVGKA